MGITLVIVDDAAFIREAVRNLVRGSDVQIVGEAADGDEALQVIADKKPDVVLMDMILPRKNGIDVTKEILSLLPEIKIVACSTEGQENMLMKALDAGCVNFLAKPFKSEDFFKVIRSAGGK
ncbi:MAG: response regulator [Bdellovibrionales bacterium]|jgi:two-component system chemotaxis response regulator CheY